MREPTTNRGRQWLAFAERVLDHIEDYTVPQYGDMPGDQASSFTLDEIAMNSKRYLNRMGRNARGSAEAIRDTYKIAHYGCMAEAILADFYCRSSEGE